MTRGQRRTHAIVFRVLAVFLLVALGYALVRRQVALESGQASLGHVRVHDAGGTP